MTSHAWADHSAAAAKEREREARKAQAELKKMRERLERDAAKQRAGTTSRTTRTRSAANPLDSILKTAGTTLVREITRSVFGTRRR